MRTYQIGAGLVSLLVVALDLVADGQWLFFKVGGINTVVYPTAVFAIAGLLLLAAAVKRLPAV